MRNKKKRRSRLKKNKRKKKKRVSEIDRLMGHYKKESHNFF